MTNILVAYDQQRAIGANNDLPWGRSLPGDLAMFKRLTQDETVVMGRKTFESLPANVRPLPDRENIVLSRDTSLDIAGAICINSLTKALDIATRKVFVIGGGQVFKEAMPLADTIFATEVHATFPEADTFFPEFDKDEWEEFYRVRNRADESRDEYDYDFVCYKRI